MLHPMRTRLIALISLLAIIVLLPLGRASELAVLVAGGFGVWRLIRDGWQPYRHATFGFAIWWLPALLALPDAVDMQDSLRITAAGLRFLPVFWLASWVLADRTRALRLGDWVSAVVLLWCIDAIVQVLSGWSLGGALTADRVSGVFGADNLKLGPALAALSPFLLAWAERRSHGVALLTVLALLVAILAAGARQAWIMFALVTLFWFWRISDGVRARFVMLSVAALLLASIAASVMYFSSHTFAGRVDRSLAALGGDRAAIDHALAGRLPIWETALTMAQAHPVNGVGVRGFRSAYVEHAAAGDPWVAGGGVAHPHHWMLEVGAETGLLGLLIWIAGLAWLLRRYLRASPDQRRMAWPAFVSLCALLFPFNTHLALYSTFWSLILCWQLAVLLALTTDPDDSHGPG